jgi:glycosyltransferase involved in cell wall biosynthesis
MKEKISLSIIIPAYNEEENILAAINAVEKEMSDMPVNYEIVVVDDGSTDRTKEIVTKYIKNKKNLKLYSRKNNMGLGFTFLEGLLHASKEYITEFHGDNESSTDFLRDFIKLIDQADIISAYSINQESRSIFRRIISDIFVSIMNILIGLHLKYYNGAFICKAKLLKGLNLVSRGFTIYAEAKIRLIKRGYSIIEIPSKQIGRRSGKSKAVNIRSIFDTLNMISIIMKELYINKLSSPNNQQ